MTEAEHIKELRLRRIERTLKVLSEVAVNADDIGVITIPLHDRVVLDDFLLRMLGIKESQDDKR